MCEDYNPTYSMLVEKTAELERTKKLSFESGFMTREMPISVFPKPGQSIYRFRPYGTNDIRSRIADRVTAREYSLLTTVTVDSPKADIEAYVSILQALLDQGIFDEENPAEPAPVVNDRPYYGFGWGGPMPYQFGNPLYSTVKPDTAGIYAGPTPTDTSANESGTSVSENKEDETK